MATAVVDRPRAISISSRESTPGRCTSVISISSDDEDSVPKTRYHVPRIKGRVETLNENNGIRTSVEGAHLSDTRRLELFRSWVDAGIEMAIREIEETKATPFNPHKNTVFRPTTSVAPSSREQPHSIDNSLHPASSSTNPPKPLPKNAILHAGWNLTFYQLAQKYGPLERVDFIGDVAYALAWNSWLERLGIDEMPYLNAWDHKGNAAHKDHVERVWSAENLEKRRMVEKMALEAKYNSFVNLHSIPLRANAHIVPRLSSLPFHEVERRYFFNVGSFSSMEGVSLKRTQWLHMIKFEDIVYLPPPSNSQQSQRINDIYASLPILRRIGIEINARFLALGSRPVTPSWKDFESQYEIYPATCFLSQSEYKAKRRQWLQSLGLDMWPFSYITCVERYNEVSEILWAEMPPAQRDHIIVHAKNMLVALMSYKDSCSAGEEPFESSKANCIN